MQSSNSDFLVGGGATPMKKQHRCPHCQRTFRRAEHVQRHVRTHTREKPYECPCSAKFTRHDLLKRHQRLAHSQEGPSRELSNTRGVDAPPDVLADTSWITQASSGRNVDLNSTASRICNTNPGITVNANPDSANHSEYGNIHAIHNVHNYFTEHHDPLQDFGDFMDVMGLELDFQWEEGFEEHGTTDAQRRREPTGMNESSFSSTTVADSDGQRLSGTPRDPERVVLPIPENHPGKTRQDLWNPNVFRLDEEDMQHLQSCLIYSDADLDCSVLPSRHALRRYLIAFFEGFDPHIPFMHAPTFDVREHTLELILAMAANGAHYRFEHKQGLLLFEASYCLLQASALKAEKDVINQLKSATPPRSSTIGLRSGQGYPADLPVSLPPIDSIHLMDRVRSLLCLVIFSSWRSEARIFRLSLLMRCELAQCIREAGLEDIDNDIGIDWAQWARLESERRTKLLAFAFLNLQSLAYNSPAQLLASELRLHLPCATPEWSATTADEWMVHRASKSFQKLTVLEASNVLINASTTGRVLSGLSPLGSYILLHTILQRVFSLRQTWWDDSVLSKDLNSFVDALHSWTQLWQQAPEASLNPQNPNGPIPFTSASLLGLAYCRICFDAGPFRCLSSRDPEKIATNLLAGPAVQRSVSTTYALLHATHALSIPVKLGLEYVSRSQGFFWSVQHSLCCLEFAILTSKWLTQLERVQAIFTPSKQEANIIDWIEKTVEQGKRSLNSPFDTPDDFSRYRNLAYSVVKIWAYIMRGNIQWSFVGCLGQALDIYAERSRQDEA